MITWEDFYTVMCSMIPLYFAMFLAYGSVKWWKIFTPEQCSGINRFVATFAVPVLSFHFISHNNPYQMDSRFILADTLSKLLVLMVLSLWAALSAAFASPRRRGRRLDWVITLFSVGTLPNTLVMGIPLLRAMYGDFTQSLMVQLVVLQCIIWYTLLLFLFEYRAATLLIEDQFPGTAAAAIAKFEIDGDIISLDGRDPIQAESEIDADGRLRVRIRRSTSSAPGSGMSSSLGITPRRLRQPPSPRPPPRLGHHPLLRRYAPQHSGDGHPPPPRHVRRLHPEPHGAAGRPAVHHLVHSAALPLRIPCGHATHRGSIPGYGGGRHCQVRDRRRHHLPRRARPDPGGYASDGPLRLRRARACRLRSASRHAAFASPRRRGRRLDWVITLFSVGTLPNTLVMGIPLLRAMYGDFTQSLMVQLVVLQCIIWYFADSSLRVSISQALATCCRSLHHVHRYTLLLFLFEYRAATLLIEDQFPGTAAAAIAKFEIDGDIISLDGRDPIQAESEIDADGRLRVRIRRSTSSAPGSGMSSSLGITPRRLRQPPSPRPPPRLGHHPLLRRYAPQHSGDGHPPPPRHVRRLHPEPHGAAGRPAVHHLVHSAALPLRIPCGHATHRGSIPGYGGGRHCQVRDRRRHHLPRRARPDPGGYASDGPLRLRRARACRLRSASRHAAFASPRRRGRRLDWVITLFSVGTLPNTLVMGIPLLRAMYGDFTQSLMVQLVVLQCIIWYFADSSLRVSISQALATCCRSLHHVHRYTLLLFLFEYRAATLLIEDQFPGTAAAAIAKFEIDGDIISLDGRDPIQAESEIDADGRLRVRIRRSTSSAPGSGMSSSLGITPRRLSNVSGAEIFSVNTPARQPQPALAEQLTVRDITFGYRSASPHPSGYASSDAYSLQPTPRASNFNELEICTPVWVRSPAVAGGVKLAWEGCGGRCGQVDKDVGEEKDLSFRSTSKFVVRKEDEIEMEGEAEQEMPAALVMLRLILTVVGRKLSRNPNTYSSILGLLWSLISFK
ncbi:hypothetical protein C4D60_Mb08t07620 [Musa balbisiana]|uniref:Auxin efflux carrier component n=1 Tax=Musa balbisiana TaxID=52838 RepID=A0A4S8K221_MUSBA|nr:hypothetical protein C4D60_Mb08t07620 [Musa balbisiana]